MRVYFAEGIEPTEQRPDDDEEIEVVRVPVNELEAMLPDLEDGKTLAGLLLYLRAR